MLHSQTKDEALDADLCFSYASFNLEAN